MIRRRLWLLVRALWDVVRATVQSLEAFIAYLWGFAIWFGIGVYVLAIGLIPVTDILGWKAAVLPNWPSWMYRYVIPLVLFSTGLIVTATTQAVRLRQLRSLLTLRPLLEMRFEPSEDGYVQKAPVGNLGYTVLYRVSMTNCGSGTAREVSVILESHKPQRSAVLPAPLHITHDNPTGGRDYKEAVDLPPGRTRFFDVVEKWPNGTPYQIPGGGQAPLPPDHFRLYFGVAGVPNMLRDGRYTLELKAVADDVPPVTRRFSVDVDPQGNLDFAAI